MDNSVYVIAAKFHDNNLGNDNNLGIIVSNTDNIFLIT